MQINLVNSRVYNKSVKAKQIFSASPSLKADTFERTSPLIFKGSKGVSFYNKNAKNYVEQTKGLKGLKENIVKFLDKLPKGGHILEAGCGSGREAKTYIEEGFKVTAFDGSKPLADLASKNIGQVVRHMEYKDVKDVEKYDGVSAHAAFVHMDDDKELHGSISALSKSLKKGGVFFTAFKHGDKTITDAKGRVQRYVNKTSFEKILAKHSELKVEEDWVAPDIMKRPDNDWYYAIMRK